MTPRTRHNHRYVDRAAILMIALAALLLTAPSAFAVSGDFKTTDFAAAAPFTYTHSTGGGAYNDRTVGDHNDITEQLEGAQFSCGDIVTYLAQIEMEAATVEANQSAEMSFRFLANSTGQAGAAHSEVVGVSINYGQVENGDDGTGVNPGTGFFGLDSGIVDDGGSTVTLLSTGLTGPLFQSGSELLLTVLVDDLEAGESVVLRIDTRLACNPGSSPTGNLQAQLSDVIAQPSNEAAGSGAQTIPFLRVGDIAGAGEPLLQVTKSVTTASGTCGVDDVEVLDIFEGDTVKYCYTISNPGTADLYDIVAIDDNGTPANDADDITLACAGLADLDGEADAGDLASGTTATCEALVLISTGGTIVNTVDVVGNNGRSGGNFAELSDSDIATVNAEGVPNQPPTANDDSGSTPEETPITIDAVANDTDPDNNLDAGSANTDCGECSLPTDGSLVNNGDGTFTYTPDENFNGEDSFVYEVCDAFGECDIATVTITVTGEPDPPVAGDDSGSTLEDQPTTINLIGNDTDIDGDLDPGSINTDCATCSGPSNGSIVINPDGTVVYTPDENFSGSDSFVYEICDESGLCDTATVTITVVPDNDSPVAEDDSYSTDEDTPLTTEAPGILGNDSDPDGDALSINLLSEPSHGSLTQNQDGSFTYTPDANFCGTDSYQYEVCDPSLACDPATVTIDVACVNDPPVAEDDEAVVPEDGSVDIPVVGNDSDPEGNLDPTSVSIVDGPDNGTVTVDPVDGSITYTPNDDFNGEDTFTYEVCDDQGACDTATVTVTVDPVNDPPVATDDMYSTDEDTPLTEPAPGILGNDSDVDGDALSATLLSSPSNGTLAQNADGSFTYTPNADFCGQDSYSYEACDASACDTATVTIDVACVNDPPSAVDDQEVTDEDMPVVIDVQGNDSAGPSNEDPSLTTTMVSDPANGTATINPDGTITYTPDANFSGTDTFTYTVCDSDNVCDSATVTVVVNPLNDPPVANPDSESTPEDTAVLVNAAANDSDIDGNLDPSSATVLEGPANGTVTDNGDGTFTYTPNDDFNGSDSFTYEICDDGTPDGTVLCDSTTVTIDVTPVNDPPVAGNDSTSTPEDTATTIDVVNNDMDVDGNLDPSSVNTGCATCSEPENGSIVINPDGSIDYTPNPDFNGEDSFTYEVCDSDGACDTATVVIDVTPVNDAPAAVNDEYTTDEDTTLTTPAPGILGNDSDVDGDALSANLLTSPSNGTLTQNADGSFVYTPDADFCGDDSYTYEACDGELCAPATVIIHVTCVPDPPTAVNDSESTEEDTPVDIAILGNDSDPEDNLDPGSVSIVSDPSNGSVVVNADGSVTYTPNENFFGQDSFVYEVCDTDGLCDTATVTVNVIGVPDPPVAADDEYSVDEDSSVSFNVNGNDSDPDGDLDVSTTTALTQPENGTLVDDGNGNFTYTPDPNFFGEDSFTYEVCDATDMCDTATVYITVDPVNDPPVALDDSYVTAQNTTLSVAAGDDSLLNQGENDYDIDGDAIYVDSCDAISAFGGSVSCNPDGSFDYTPATDFAGYDTFTYTICDGNGGCDTATVTIEVTAKNGRSISVSWGDWSLNQPLLSGFFDIRNQSGDYDVQLQGYEITVQYRVSGGGKPQWIDVAVEGCTFDPAAPTMLIDTLTVSFTGCELQAAIPAGSTVRVTAEVGIYGHKDKGKNKQVFLSRLSRTI